LIFSQRVRGPYGSASRFRDNPFEIVSAYQLKQRAPAVGNHWRGFGTQLTQRCPALAQW
jgi:hypothetical protein